MANDLATGLPAGSQPTPSEASNRADRQRYRRERDRPSMTLLDLLWEQLEPNGTKKAADDHVECGACTVRVNGRRVNALVVSGAGPLPS